MTFKIITDSTADLDENWAQAQDIDILGLTITLNDKTYPTVGPERVTSEFLLQAMKDGAQPTTSQVNVGQFEASFKTYAQEGRPILYLAFSSVLSGTYQSSQIAREMVLEAYPNAIIEIIDTRAAAGGEGYLSILAAQMREQGASLEEVKAKIIDVLPRLRTFFLVDDLYHLMRGGRLSKSSALIGSLVNIKPLLWLDAEGKLVPLAKLRGRKKGMKEMLVRATQDVETSTAIVAYSKDEANAQELKAKLLENSAISEVLMMPLGPVISAHVGPKTLAIFTIGHEPR